MKKSTNYQLGAAKERRLIKKYKEEGDLAFRSAGSHSPIDVFVLKKKERIIKLIQSKPKSMSKNAKEKLLKSLQHLNGYYYVEVSVE